MIINKYDIINELINMKKYYVLYNCEGEIIDLSEKEEEVRKVIKSDVKLIEKEIIRRVGSFIVEKEIGFYRKNGKEEMRLIYIEK